MQISFKKQIYRQVIPPGMMYIIPRNDINQARQFTNGIFLKDYTTLLHG
jgi:hypothetical protein